MNNLADRTGLDQIRRDMDVICTQIGRRLAGSPEEDRTADFVVQRFRDLGLVNIAKLPFRCRRWLPGHAEIQILDSSGRPDSGSAPGVTVPIQQITHTPPTPPEGIEGNLVVLEPVDWEKGLRVTNLDGKIGLFWGPYGESATVFGQLHDSPLKALLFVNTRLQTDWAPADGVGEKYMALIRKPMAYVSLTHAWALVRDGVRRVRLTCTGRAEDGTSCNVVGELPGSDSSSRVVAVAGHMDSVSVGVGADDDASGVVAMLECARRLRERPRQNAARFIGFGAEEQLSVGSARYMLEQVTDTDRLAFVCNFDGIAAHAGMSSVMCTGTRGLEEFVRRIIVERLQFGEVHSDVCPYQDQFWFTAKGIPGIWMTRKTHLNGYWYHHSIHNDLSAVSMEQIAWTAEAACELMKPLLAASKWPFPRRIPAALMTRIDRYTREIF